MKGFLLGTGAAARRLQVSVMSLHRWNTEGRLVPVFVDSENRRLYTEEQIAEFAAKRMAEKLAAGV